MLAGRGTFEGDDCQDSQPACGPQQQQQQQQQPRLPAGAASPQCVAFLERLLAADPAARPSIADILRVRRLPAGRAGQHSAPEPHALTPAKTQAEPSDPGPRTLNPT
jgi:hypothetical protein